jgi:hypothetical protein
MLNKNPPLVQNLRQMNSAHRLSIFSKGIMTSPSKQKAGENLKLGYSHFFTNPLRFITHESPHQSMFSNLEPRISYEYNKL